MLKTRTKAKTSSASQDYIPISYEDFMIFWEDGLFQKIFSGEKGKDPKEVLVKFLKSLSNSSKILIQIKPDIKSDWAYLKLLLELTPILYKYDSGKVVPNQFEDCLCTLKSEKTSAHDMVNFFSALVYAFENQKEISWDWDNDDINNYWQGLHGLIFYPGLKEEARFQSGNLSWNDLTDLFLAATNYD